MNSRPEGRKKGSTSHPKCCLTLSTGNGNEASEKADPVTSDRREGENSCSMRFKYRQEEN